MPKLPTTGIVSGSRTYRVPTDIRTGDFKRDFHIHIPKGYDGHQQLPMVVVVHGAFDNAKGIEKISGFSEMADRENFIVLYPNGIGIFGFFQHWNAGHCCGKAQAEQIDDVGFVASIIESAIKRLQVDRNRIYMVGFSNGGMFTHRFAAEKSHLLAGATALAASIGSRTPDAQDVWQIPKPSNPIPFLIVHGTADTHVPYGHQASQRRGTPRYYQSVEESTAFWRSRNGCDNAQTPLPLLDGDVAQLIKWSECSSKPVWQLTLKEWGHIWPGPHFTAQLAADNPYKSFDIAEIIWNFFNTASR